MTAPTIKVEMGFGYGPLTDPAAIVWTDVTSRVLDCSITRGRATELDAFSPGTLSLVLNNYDRRFDPEHAASPYVGNIKANVPVRVTTTSPASNRFYGFVDGWPQSYTPPADAQVTLTATDGFKVLGWLTLPASDYGLEVSTDAPLVWWRLGDASVIALDSSGHGYDATLSEAATPTDGLIDGAGQATALPQDSNAHLSSANNALNIAPPFTIELWAKFTGPLSNYLWLQQSAVADYMVQLQTYTNGAIVFQWSKPGVGLKRVDSAILTTTPQTSACNIYDGKRHHIVATVSAGNVAHIYVDAVDVTVNSYTFGSGWGATQPSLQIPSAIFAETPGLVIVLDDTAIYASELTPARVLAHFVAGVQPWVNDSTGTRLGRILDTVSWPAAQRSIDTGETLLGAAVLDPTRSLLDYMQGLEQSEQGRLFMSGAGKVVFQSRNHDLTTATGNTSQALFTDSGAGIEYEASGFELTRDDRYLFRQVQGSRDGGQIIVVRDSTLVATDEVQTRTLTSMARTDAEVRNMLESFLLRYKSAKTRASAFTVMPLASTADWTTVLALDIGYRVTVEAKPQNIGARFSADFLIESIAEHWPSVTSGATVTFTTSPADATNYFLWDSSLLDGAAVLR